MSGSVSEWIEAVKTGDSSATTHLWNWYYPNLLRFARHRLHDEARRVTDEEDLVAATFESFFARAVSGQFPKLSDRDALWALLVTITDRKVVNATRRYMTRKRGGGRVRGELNHDEQGGESEKVRATTGSTYLPPDVAARLSEMMGTLDEDMRRIIGLKIDGYTNEEIGQRLNRSLATIERRLCLLRDQWVEELFG
ncbi:MAG: ECF-type sigma factor [Planctomycetota bacterium]